MYSNIMQERGRQCSFLSFLQILTLFFLHYTSLLDTYFLYSYQYMYKLVYLHVSIVKNNRKVIVNLLFMCHVLFIYLQSWDAFFSNVNAGLSPGQAFQRPPSLGVVGGASSIPVEVDIGTSDQKIIQDHLNVQALIRAYQVCTITIGLRMNVTLFVSTCTCINTCNYMYMNKLKWGGIFNVYFVPCI